MATRSAPNASRFRRLLKQTAQGALRQTQHETLEKLHPKRVLLSRFYRSVQARACTVASVTTNTEIERARVTFVYLSAPILRAR